MSAIPPQYNFVKVLGVGAFGEVVLLEKKTDPNAKVATKKMVPQSRMAMEVIKNECLVLKALTIIGHDNVIKIFGMQADYTTFWMHMEYVDGGELFDKISDGLSLEKAKFYFRQLVDGLFFLHENGVVHRDIKPENLLLTKSDTLKIADFGLSAFYRNENGEEKMLTQKCGTKEYIAPEVFENTSYRGPPVDVWSAGIILAVMVTGVQLWESATDASFHYLLWITNCYEDKEPWRNMDEDTIKFLRKILIEDIEARPTIQQVKEDPWLAVEEEATKSLKRKAIENESSSNDEQVESCATEKRQRLEISSETSSE
ncbi:unnamed protein product [Caenorhabditis brenneri]